MLYDFTIDFNSGGNHGHQLKDALGGLTVGQLTGLRYVHTPYEYLDYFGIGYNCISVNREDRHKLYDQVINVSGPLWDGVDNFNEFKEKFQLLTQLSTVKKLFVFEKALRVHPFQTIPWYSSGLIRSPVFDLVSSVVSKRFASLHNISEVKGSSIKTVAVHINRGVDYDPIKKPQHFEGTQAVRYMFPMSYFDNIITQIRYYFGWRNVIINIYTEKFNSEEIVNTFDKRDGINILLGPNRSEKNNKTIHKIFFDFFQSDILVTSNSSFSAVCAYYRRGKQTIYHPHKHLDYLPEPEFITTDDEGFFNTALLKNIPTAF